MLETWRSWILAVVVMTATLSGGKALAQFRWELVRQPSPANVEKVWPAAAKAKGVGGSAVMVCDLVEGVPSSCKIVSEHPAGAGFGEALLSLAAEYRLKGMYPAACRAYLHHTVLSQVSPKPDHFANWLQRPRGEDVASAYPPAALLAKIPGEVALECALTDAAILSSCVAVHEAPQRWLWSGSTFVDPEVRNQGPDSWPKTGWRHRRHTNEFRSDHRTAAELLLSVGPSWRDDS